MLQKVASDLQSLVTSVIHHTNIMKLFFPSQRTDKQKQIVRLAKLLNCFNTLRLNGKAEDIRDKKEL